MNPLKRKKLYRLELSKQKNKTEIQVEQKVTVTEPIKLAEAIQETAPVEAAELPMGLKVSLPVETSTETAATESVVENKKEKKKKWSSQDA
jgi:hypothetical protein